MSGFGQFDDADFPSQLQEELRRRSAVMANVALQQQQVQAQQQAQQLQQQQQHQVHQLQQQQQAYNNNTANLSGILGQYYQQQAIAQQHHQQQHLAHHPAPVHLSHASLHAHHVVPPPPPALGHNNAGSLAHLYVAQQQQRHAQQQQHQQQVVAHQQQQQHQQQVVAHQQHQQQVAAVAAHQHHQAIAAQRLAYTNAAAAAAGTDPYGRPLVVHQAPPAPLATSNLTPTHYSSNNSPNLHNLNSSNHHVSVGPLTSSLPPGPESQASHADFLATHPGARLTSLVLTAVPQSPPATTTPSSSGGGNGTPAAGVLASSMPTVYTQSPATGPNASASRITATPGGASSSTSISYSTPGSIHHTTPLTTPGDLAPSHETYPRHSVAAGAAAVGTDAVAPIRENQGGAVLSSTVVYPRRVITTRQHGDSTIVSDGQREWYMGVVPLGMEDDRYWLSELQVYLRMNFAEAFGATQEDISAPMHGRNKPIALGQVGIRCMHCKQDNPAERGQQSTSYPSMISGIYNSVQQMLRLHLDCCLSMPHGVRARIEQLKTSCSSRGGRKQYWIDSAKRLGLIDTPHGIHFGREPKGPLPPLSGPSMVSLKPRRVLTSESVKKTTKKLLSKLQTGANAFADGSYEAIEREEEEEEDEEEVDNRIQNGRSPESNQSGVLNQTPVKGEFISPEKINIVAFILKEKEKENQKLKEKKAKAKSPALPPPPPPPVDSRPLVFPDDKSLISDYLYLTLQQMAPCALTEADRVGCYKTRDVGFLGLACKHCVGQAGCGRYFPASEASLSQTTTSQTMMNHVRNCRRCPVEVRENLELMKRTRTGPDGKRSDKPKHGGRKVFFHRLWCRIQDKPFEDGKGETKESKRNRSRKSDKRSSNNTFSDDETSDDDEEDFDDVGDDGPPPLVASDQETDTEDGDLEEQVKAGTSTAKAPRVKKPSPGKAERKNKSTTSWWHGCVQLTKTDDPTLLSEMECFVRSEIIEAFSLVNMDECKISYQGRKLPNIGQVGIRCRFCKEDDPSERMTGSIVFPESLDQIHVKVETMIKQHLSNCHGMPDDVREMYKSLRGFDAKIINEDSEQYWVDAARDIGLTNTPPISRDAGGWGLSFRRDPLEPSPADELDLDPGGIPVELRKGGTLIRNSDRGLCPDQLLLMMLQIRPCRFKGSDRRVGPSSRGRDRVMGFPGLCCMHCTNKNTLGRYFPVSAKNLTDSTANSLQSHVSSCARCPESIRASLAYLSHRAVRQKAELSGIWKKKFFKTIWERIHVNRNWKSIDDEDYDDQMEQMDDAPLRSTDRVNILAKVATSMRNGFDTKKSDLDDEGNDAADPKKGKHRGLLDDSDTLNAGDEDAAAESDEEELGDAMNALIKAAAIWLTEQDAIGDKSKLSSAPKVSRGRTLLAKRSLGKAPTAEAEDVSPIGYAGASTSRTRNGGAAASSKRRRIVS